MTLAKIIADSLSPEGVRLTTMEIVLPRIVLAELNTHRVMSKSSASSRAIPIKKMLRMVRANPYIPERWGLNGKGMQDHGELDTATGNACEAAWLEARDNAIESVEKLLKIGVHKQTTNRLLEPFMWHTVIVTSTEWSNFFHLRSNPMAHPAIRRTSDAMVEVMAASDPTPKAVGEWHLPFVDERDADLSTEDKVKVSAARCARVSYLTHDGKRDPAKDLALYDKLRDSGHMSPFEHPATPMHDGMGAGDLHAPMGFVERRRWDQVRCGNFRGWRQHRKEMFGEQDMLAETKTERLEGSRFAGYITKAPHPATTAFLTRASGDDS